MKKRNNKIKFFGVGAVILFVLASIVPVCTAFCYPATPEKMQQIIDSGGLQIIRIPIKGGGFLCYIKCNPACFWYEEMPKK